MNLTLVLECVGIIGGVATILALMLGPMFYLGSKLDNFRKEFKQDIEDFKKEIRQDMNEFRKETKDFHGRLCSLEERNKR